jgi:osmotically-inducible protein OsmY
MKKCLLLMSLLNSLLLGACQTMPPDDLDLSPAALLQERRTHETLLTDKEIETDAYAELGSYEDIRRQCHVNINAYNGAVLVTGEAANAELGKKIIATVQGIDNIKLIHNNLAITQPSDVGSRTNDALITDTIKIALKQIRTIPDFDPAMVKAVTENGIVYLMGAVHRNEGKVVVNVTRLQPGIKQIITIFQYLD